MNKEIKIINQDGKSLLNLNKITLSNTWENTKNNLFMPLKDIGDQ